jgi:hypothetical protein
MVTGIQGRSLDNSMFHDALMLRATNERRTSAKQPPHRMGRGTKISALITEHGNTAMARYLKTGITEQARADADSKVRATVEGIIADIDKRGDAAVREYSIRFDSWSPEEFRLTRAQIDTCYDEVGPRNIEDIKFAQAQIRNFAQIQKDTLRDVERRGLDLVICVDTSRSMLVQDVKPDRLTRAKREVHGLLDKLQTSGDRVALVAFSGDVRAVAPLTHDQAQGVVQADACAPLSSFVALGDRPSQMHQLGTVDPGAGGIAVDQ